MGGDDVAKFNFQMPNRINLTHEEIQQLIDENEALKEENRILKSKLLVNPRKISDEDVTKIKELRASGLSYRAISKNIGWSTCTILRALEGAYD